MMNWIAILGAILQLAAYVSRLAGDAKTEKAITDAIELLQAKRVDKAAVARDAVEHGGVPDGKPDPNNRDG